MDGLHRHALMTMIAFASSSTAASRPEGEKRIARGPPQPSLPAIRRAITAVLPPQPPQRCPHCRFRLRPPPNPHLSRGLVHRGL